MELLLSVIVVCLCITANVIIWRVGKNISEINAARIQQEGITLRAREKLATAEKSQGKEEWYVPILANLAANPEIQKILLEKLTPMMVGQRST